ncbi:hypothetical protein CTI12_AA415720 [Artemisia annua]|uniref:Uncharacterized protein n=1 Tax=Artemisia annua TaxID=35608 RepID=A0A2U1M656_ARTAN|nr:hypothetical protein CTI12_AA415720 [Artemisia annua]
MEATISWCNLGCRSHIRRQFKTDNNVLITMSLDMSLNSPIWRILWRKIKKDKKTKKKKNVCRVSNATQFSYDPSEYAQNFDQGLMLDDCDDLSRSFSARFAVPSMVFHHGLIV